MKSFKKIALAMVAAMGLSTLTSTPASASTLSVVSATWNASLTPAAFDTVTTGVASTAPITRPVPEDNKIDNVDVVRFEATVVAGTPVTVTATNATIVSALHTDAAPVSASSGSSSLTIATGTGTTATFFVYTKTTAIGSVVISNGVNTVTRFVQGTVGKVNTLTLTSPDAGTTSSVITATATATDVFGNRVPSISLTALVVGGTLLDTATATTGTTLTNFGQADFRVTLPVTGQSTLVVRLTDATANGAVAVPGFNTPVTSAVRTITVRDLLGELAAANAALAAEKTARAAEKAASDKALADALAKAAADAATAKAAADAAATKAAADLVTANAEIAKLKADAVTAKVASDKALADANKALTDAIAKASADAVAAKAASDKALSDLKRAFNKLARQWNKANPKARVALLK